MVKTSFPLKLTWCRFWYRFFPLPTMLAPACLPAFDKWRRHNHEGFYFIRLLIGQIFRLNGFLAVCSVLPLEPQKTITGVCVRRHGYDDVSFVDWVQKSLFPTAIREYFIFVVCSIRRRWMYGGVGATVNLFAQRIPLSRIPRQWPSTMESIHWLWSISRNDGQHEVWSAWGRTR